MDGVSDDNSSEAPLPESPTPSQVVLGPSPRSERKLKRLRSPRNSAAIQKSNDEIHSDPVFLQPAPEHPTDATGSSHGDCAPPVMRCQACHAPDSAKESVHGRSRS